MLPLPPPEPLALLQAAAEDSVTAGLASLPQDLRSNSTRHVVMLRGRDAYDGDAWITIKGCTTTGFHGTPHRWTVGRAVSHGCVRLYNEDVSALYRQVLLGTQVTVLP